jgi:hypothetical protein
METLDLLRAGLLGGPFGQVTSSLVLSGRASATSWNTP